MEELDVALGSTSILAVRRREVYGSYNDNRWYALIISPYPIKTSINIYFQNLFFWMRIFFSANRQALSIDLMSNQVIHFCFNMIPLAMTTLNGSSEL